MAPSEDFQKAIQDSKKLTSKPSNDELLDLYGMPDLPPFLSGDRWREQDASRLFPFPLSLLSLSSFLPNQL